MNIVILGLSITSSWGNGHATTYRGLVRALSARGHRVLFLERDLPWYAANRDMPEPPFCRIAVYDGLTDLAARFASDVRNAHLVIVGSYVPQGIEVGEWVSRIAGGVTAFYDIDTPVTIAGLEQGECEYISPDLIPRYTLYLSFTGGSALRLLEDCYGSPAARPLYCSFDPEVYYPEARELEWDLGYLGTYSADRQPALDRLLIEPALRWPEGRFAVAGPQYPSGIKWPRNVRRMQHLPPSEHRAFYNAQRFALNVTRQDMVRAGYSPSVRLFEAAACATPIISDCWEGLDEFFDPGKEILISCSRDETLWYLREMPDEGRRSVGEAARRRVVASHTASHRAAELEAYVSEVASGTLRT